MLSQRGRCNPKTDIVSTPRHGLHSTRAMEKSAKEETESVWEGGNKNTVKKETLGSCPHVISEKACVGGSLPLHPIHSPLHSHPSTLTLNPPHTGRVHTLTDRQKPPWKTNLKWVDGCGRVEKPLWKGRDVWWWWWKYPPTPHTLLYPHIPFSWLLRATWTMSTLLGAFGCWTLTTINFTTSTPQHINISTYQHINISTHQQYQHINISTYQRINIIIINTSTYQHLMCWCVDVLMTYCIDVLMCWCVDVLMCWCVDVLIDVLCWCVDDIVLMCWWHCVDALLCWCVECWCVDMLMCWCWYVDNYVDQRINTSTRQRSHESSTPTQCHQHINTVINTVINIST